MYTPFPAVLPLLMNLNKGCIEIVFNDITSNPFNMMNLNKGCIEISRGHPTCRQRFQMNLNKGCIEIVFNDITSNPFNMMNLNKGCIEIFYAVL